MKQKISRKEREAARAEAIQRTDELASLAQEVRQNDTIGSHFTLWLCGSKRIDWWPGARHWREQTTDHYGSIEEFFTWIKEQQ